MFFLLIFLHLQLFCNAEIKLDSLSVEQLATQLLKDNDFQTKMIVKKIRRNHWLSFRVIPKDNVKDFVVDWEDLSSSMIGNTENDFYQKTNKYFEKDGNDKLILKIEKIFHLIKEDYLTLSYVYQFMADVQSECLTKFLFKKYGRDYLIQIEALNKVQNEETAIQNKYKIKYKNKYYVYRLDTDKTIFTQQELPIERYDEKGEHTKEEEFRYKNLKKCIEIFHRTRSYETEVEGVKYIDLNKLYKRFDPKQLYFREFPILVENNTFEFNQSFIEEYKNENNENKLECSICLLEFGIGDIVQMTKCNHLFHNDCIQPWFYENSTCPICRKDLNKIKEEIDEKENMEMINPIFNCPFSSCFGRT
ncbi:hypothetical protein ACQ4LE_010942 [Meloidogyne hapla]